MHPARRWATFLILPLIVFIERFAAWGGRTFQWSLLYDIGWEREAIRTLMATELWVTAGCTLLGGLLAIVAGPWPVMVLALLISAFGAAMTSAPGIEDPSTWLVVQAGGWGLLRPALWASAIVAFARPHEAARNGLLVLMWGSMNLAGLIVGVSVGPFLSLASDVRPIYVVTAAGQGLAALLAAALGVLWLATRRPTPAGSEPDPTQVWHTPTALAALGLLVLLAPAWTAVMAVWEPLSTTFTESPVGMTSEAWFNTNPIVVIWMAAVLAAIFLRLVITRRNLPTLLVAGPGLVLLGLGVGLLSVDAARATVVGLGCGVGGVRV